MSLAKGMQSWPCACWRTPYPGRHANVMGTPYVRPRNTISLAFQPDLGTQPRMAQRLVIFDCAGGAQFAHVSPPNAPSKACRYELYLRLPALVDRSFARNVARC